MTQIRIIEKHATETISFGSEKSALRWLDEQLALQGTTAEELVREEHHRQGAMNVTVRNVITSMRLVSAIDWAELFESVSLVDEELRAGSDFAEMDFATRDRYRHAIEELSRGSGLPELEVARRALEAGVAVVPGAPFFSAAGGERNIRISYSQATEKRLEEGIALLGPILTARA